MEQLVPLCNIHLAALHSVFTKMAYPSSELIILWHRERNQNYANDTEMRDATLDSTNTKPVSSNKHMIKATENPSLRSI